jgi:CheY-like chemotaxis protein
VLLNLMANALRFTSPGGSVTTTMAMTEDGERLRCSVTDDGPGVPLERQDAIFLPFVQADPAVGRTHGGSGLGLSICRQLVERMAGAIGVDSTPGKGSTFWFEVPLPACPAAERPGDDSSRVVRAGRMGLRILLAEDDDICRFAVGRMLETLGCTHVAVGDGHAALSAWESGGWDAVLMDLHMPVMDGPTAIRAIRDRQGGTAQHIIALTAATDPSELARCRSAGADAVAAKPLSLSGLRRALRGIAAARGGS